VSFNVYECAAEHFIDDIDKFLQTRLDLTVSVRHTARDTAVN